MRVTPYILATVIDDDAGDGARGTAGGGWNSGRDPGLRPVAGGKCGPWAAGHPMGFEGWPVVVAPRRYQYRLWP